MAWDRTVRARRQVDQTVRVAWVQPRVLQQSQIALMTERLKSWCETVNKTSTMLDSEGASTFF